MTWDSRNTESTELRREIASLRKTVQSLVKAVSGLAAVIEHSSTTEDNSVPSRPRHVPLADAVAEIRELFKANPSLFYSDIANATNLDLGVVIDACETLEREGMIEEVK